MKNPSSNWTAEERLGCIQQLSLKLRSGSYAQKRHDIRDTITYLALEDTYFLESNRNTILRDIEIEEKGSIPQSTLDEAYKLYEEERHSWLASRPVYLVPFTNVRAIRYLRANVPGLSISEAKAAIEKEIAAHGESLPTSTEASSSPGPQAMSARERRNLRNMFANSALRGILATHSTWDTSFVAKTAFQYAAAMLKESERNDS